MKSAFKFKNFIGFIIFKIEILFLLLSYVLNGSGKKTICIQSNGKANGIKVINELNNITTYEISELTYFRFIGLECKVIDSKYGGQIIISLSRLKDEELSIGILLIIEDLNYKLNNDYVISHFTENYKCAENDGAKINEIFEIKITKCSDENIFSINVFVYIPFNKYDYDCYESCSECDGDGNELNQKCTICNNTKGYFFKEDDKSQNCFTIKNIDDGYYFDPDINLFKKCNNRCFSCDSPGTVSNSNCIKCQKDYHFDPTKPNHCIKFSELDSVSFYVDKKDDKFQKCHESCLTCDGPNNNDCLSCNGRTYFETEYFNNRCLKVEEVPHNYYVVFLSGIIKYSKCHISCKRCFGGGENKCLECNIEEGFYPVEDKAEYCFSEKNVPKKYYLDINETMNKKCLFNCETCSKGYDNDTDVMNCDTCINGTYFQNISSSNCISKPETRYYIDLYEGKGTLFPCHDNCLTCNRGGNDTDHHCLSCIYDLYFDDEIITNCVDDDKECAIGCAKCFKNASDSKYGILSADKMCKRCSHKMGYYPLQKYSPEQFYVYCYPYNKSPLNYLYDEKEKIHKLCYQTCGTCFKVGNRLNHSCLSCDNSYMFIDEEPFNCLPKCMHYYYYNKYNQTKCTENDECPLEYPYLISNKSKCVDNCYNDNEFILLFKNECFKNCPEGTSVHLYIYNAEITAKCINSDEILDENDCKLNVKNEQLDYEKITDEVLQQYADNYIYEYPVVNTYVTSYASSIDSENKYLIVIYKLEKCPKQKVVGFFPIGLEECIDKIKTKYTIIQNIVIQIFYYIRKNYPPQIKYNLYHPDTGERLNLSECSGSKFAFKTSVFDNGKVDEKLVKYFADLKINIFDINDPFFTDICFNFSIDEKDVPLDDRIELYYQNISLCDSGCSYIGINLETFEVECSCSVQNIESNTNIDIAKSFLDNPLSNEVFGLITNSNIEVLKCIKKAFNLKIVFRNYGGLMMIGIFIVQVILTCFIKYQNRQVRNYIYSIIIKLKFPPKRKNNFERTIYLNKYEYKSEANNRQSKDNLIYYSSYDETNNKNLIKVKDKDITNLSIKNKDKEDKKRGSIDSVISLEGSKEKYTYVKKGSIPNSTQYTNITKRGSNIKNSSNENINEILNINNNDRSGSSQWSSFGNSDIRINSGGSDSDLKNMRDMEEKINNEEFRYDDDDKNNNNGYGVKRKKFFEEIYGVGTYIGLNIPKRNSDLNLDSCFRNKNKNSHIIENGINNNKTKVDNIPINEIILCNGNKSKKILKKNFTESKKTKKGKVNSSKRFDKKLKEILFIDFQNNNNTINSKNKLEKDKENNNLKDQLRKEILSEIKEEKKLKETLKKKRKQIFVTYEHKEYNEKEMNELDYEEAIIYDKRPYCQIFWFTLKEKQVLVNAFFAKDPLKPLSIKLLVIIFSFSCYFVINGFLYNEEYVSIKLKSEGNKSFLEYISDSIERILYTSIVGGVISFIIGILFNTDKKINNVINKNKNQLFLKGQIAKIYRCNAIRIICFIIIQFILMVLFIIYIFCFCFVYQNNKLDWFESSLIIITLMQSFSFFTTFLFSLFKFLSIKFQWELCFKINTYLEDNL